MIPKITKQIIIIFFKLAKTTSVLQIEVEQKLKNPSLSEVDADAQTQGAAILEAQRYKLVQDQNRKRVYILFGRQLLVAIAQQDYLRHINTQCKR